MDDRNMESPRKFNDCYFYYYSTCTKGDNCVFRHEPSALGCETMCSLWQQGRCLDKRCKLRHMELRKNRKQIPCYWENQPGGCRKKHCPFMHKNPEARSDGIMPSQAIPQYDGQTICSAPDAVPVEPLGVPAVSAMPGGVPTVSAVPGAVPGVPMLWQQQRQVVLDSAILGVGVGGAPPAELLRRHEPPPYPLPVDPLVVKFEEESDGETATPGGTPTKAGAGAGTGVGAAGAGAVGEGVAGAGAASDELLLLARIQAEAAAYYDYSAAPAPPPAPADRRLVRPSLAAKYDRLSLDELTGKKTPDNKNLDFKVMSLDEIRAKKRHSDGSAPTHKPITLNLNRKRKLSSQETIVDAGNKIIKLVRSNSIVYKKFDKPNETAHKVDKEAVSRKRTVSEQSEVLVIQDDELEDDCYKFKKVKMDEEFTNKPTLIRTRSLTSDVESKADETKDDSDSEVQIVCEKICYDAKRTGEVIDLDNADDVVDLSDEDDVVLTDRDLGLGKSVPDVVASCQASGLDEAALLESDSDTEADKKKDEHVYQRILYNSL